MSSRVSLRRARRALVVAMGLLGSVGAQAASAVTVRVDDDRAQCPDASFRRISPALAAVPPDSTVVVCPGTYVEALRMNKPGVRVIGLRGRHSDIVLMQAPGADPSIPMVEMSAPDTTLAAVKIRDSRTAPEAGCVDVGVLVDNGAGSFAGASVVDNVTVRQLAFGSPFQCGVRQGTGVRVGASGESGRPGRAIVRNSTLVAPTNGLHVTAGSEASVRGNVITSARPGLAGGGGIFIEGGTVRFVRNDVSRFNLGVFAFSGQALVFGNTIHDGRVGVSLGFGMTGATAIDNDIRRGVEGFVVGSVGALVSGNRIDVDGGLAFDVQDPASRNQFVANVATDGECSDSTRGAGTAGTANTWIDNIGAPSFPPKICRPPSP